MIWPKLPLAFVTAAVFFGLGCASSKPKDKAPPPRPVTETLPQEELFGAEVQYFRLRGGYGPNIPRAKVLALWAKALDQAKAARMNTIGFYIPWDFHEYAEGKFDFDGTVDADGDGNPDYPSRDVKTFLKMAEERGFKNIHVRPGPYINAEWGFLGFGAIPLWFHNKYPEAHMHDAKGLKTKLVSYDSDDLLRHAKLYFQRVLTEVLDGHLGQGKSIRFLQIDNETNFLWQSIYHHDFGPKATARYRQFLQSRYKTIEELNKQHNRQYASWDEVKGPPKAGLSVVEDQDWYRFQDQTIYDYLKSVRAIWEALGVHEPSVHFTLADSYNAANHGLLPNFKLHNDKAIGVMSMNLYPKVIESELKPFLNMPFKSDHDIIAQNAASEAYWGAGTRWMMGPETQTGWWRGTSVTPEARQQTYLSVLGHGAKGMYLYYFHEGDHWDSGWLREQVEPLYKELKASAKYKKLKANSLPDTFWRELQKKVDHSLVVGIQVKHVMLGDTKIDEQLYFDAPLDGEANPRPHFQMVKDIGEKVIEPHRGWLRQATPVSDPVCLVKDVATHVPSQIASIDNVKMNADWSAGLIGYAMHAGVNPQILHWGINAVENFNECRIFLNQDNGEMSPELMAYLKTRVENGSVVINFLNDSLPRSWGVALKEIEIKNPVAEKNRKEASAKSDTDSDPEAESKAEKLAEKKASLLKSHELRFGKVRFAAAASPFFQYTAAPGVCAAVMQGENNGVSAYRCTVGKGSFFQVGALFYDVFNNSHFATTNDLAARVEFLKSILRELSIVPVLQVSEKHDHIVAFALETKTSKARWITVKHGTKDVASFTLQVHDLEPKIRYQVRDMLGGTAQTIDGETLRTRGFEDKLGPFGSTVFWLEPADQVSRL